MTHPTYTNVTDEQQGGLFTDPLEDQWRAFHEANPQVWRAFERLTLDAIRNDQKVGAKAVWERMRWFLKVETTEDAPRLNNNWTAYYARHFHACHPLHEGYFATREIRS